MLAVDTSLTTAVVNNDVQASPGNLLSNNSFHFEQGSVHAKVGVKYLKVLDTPLRIQPRH